jgi:hypothetical protein
MTNHPDITDIELPEIPRKYVKQQRKGERTFSASGPKADIVMRHLIAGGFTAAQIAEAAECSLSRVRECQWALDAAGIEYPALARAPRKPKATATPDPEKFAAIEAEIVEQKTKRIRKPAAVEVVAEVVKPTRARSRKA